MMILMIMYEKYFEIILAFTPSGQCCPFIMCFNTYPGTSRASGNLIVLPLTPAFCLGLKFYLNYIPNRILLRISTPIRVLGTEINERSKFLPIAFSKKAALQKRLEAADH